MHAHADTWKRVKGNAKAKMNGTIYYGFDALFSSYIFTIILTLCLEKTKIYILKEKQSFIVITKFTIFNWLLFPFDFLLSSLT